MGHCFKTQSATSYKLSLWPSSFFFFCCSVLSCSNFSYNYSNQNLYHNLQQNCMFDVQDGKRSVTCVILSKYKKCSPKWQIVTTLYFLQVGESPQHSSSAQSGVDFLPRTACFELFLWQYACCIRRVLRALSPGETWIQIRCSKWLPCVFVIMWVNKYSVCKGWYIQTNGMHLMNFNVQRCRSANKSLL